MYSWMNKKLQVAKTEKYGKGVFSLQDIAAGETLIVMGGYVIDIEAENKLDAFQIDKPIEISEDFSFCPRVPADMDLMPQHYINHSCDPNAGFKFSNFIVAIRDIKAGEEILYDYAMIIASNEGSDNYFEMKCECGSEVCRGVINEEGWKERSLQERYAGFFQGYIELKIKESGYKTL